MVQKSGRSVKQKLYELASHSQQSRLELCGRTMPRMRRADGEIIDDAVYRCKLKHCTYCARKRAQTVYACCEARVDESGADPSACRMVTLTVRLPDGLGRERLESNLRIVADIQRRAHQRLRDHADAHARLKGWQVDGRADKVMRWREACRERIPPARQKRDKNHSTTYGSTGYQPPSLGRVTYIWHREITTGSNGHRWHVHLHYLVPCLADAEALVGAWDASSGQVDPTECDIAVPRGADREGVQAAAAYITHYITGDEWQRMPPWQLKIYLEATHGRRGYDAAGEWRPLGIGPDERAPQERVTAVERVHWRVDTRTGEVWAQSADWIPAPDFFGMSVGWDQWRDRWLDPSRDLNQLRTKLRRDADEVELLLKLGFDVPRAVWQSVFRHRGGKPCVFP